MYTMVLSTDRFHTPQVNSTLSTHAPKPRTRRTNRYHSMRRSEKKQQPCEHIPTPSSTHPSLTSPSSITDPSTIPPPHILIPPRTLLGVQLREHDHDRENCSDQNDEEEMFGCFGETYEEDGATVCRWRGWGLLVRVGCGIRVLVLRLIVVVMEVVARVCETVNAIFCFLRQ